MLVSQENEFDDKSRLVTKTLMYKTKANVQNKSFSKMSWEKSAKQNNVDGISKNK